MKFSFSNFASGVGGAVSELFAADASRAKAGMYRTEAQMDLLKGEGAMLEGKSYGRAQELALQNKDFAAESTAIQMAQADRSIYMATGAIRATAGGSGLAQSGSVLDVLSDSARQGELEKQVLAKQGLITEAGYQEQADVYSNMVDASKIAVEASTVAAKGHLEAADAEEDAATGHDIGAVIKGVGAVASLFGL
jgi:hypothetical protein